MAGGSVLQDKVIRTKSMELFEHWLKTWTPQGKKVAVVYGPTGVGKTTTIRYVARQLGYDVVSYDYTSKPSHEQLLARVRARSWGRPVLVHLDRPLESMGMKGRELGRLVRYTINPIVIETEDERRYRWLSPASIRVDPPPKTAIAKLLKEIALVKPNFRLVGTDVRQAMMLAYGADTYRDSGWSQALEECLKTGSCSEIEDSHLPALLDSYVAHCYGLECIQAIMLLLAADITKHPGIVLDGFRVGHGITRPVMYFYQKWRAAKEAEVGKR